ncbi:MAG: RNA polymerase sigma factor [Chitinophagales bacterium]
MKNTVIGDTLTNQTIIEGFRNGDTRMIINAYKIARPRIYAYVLRNTGTENDAKELVWECMEAFRKRCLKDTNFELEVEFGLYMYGIGRYKWIDKMKANAKVEISTSVTEIVHHAADDIQQQHEIREMLDYVKTCMKSLQQGCQVLFKLYCFDNLPHEEIAAKLNIQVGNSRKRLLDCRKKLAILLKQNPSFHSFKNEALIHQFVSKVMRK